MLGGFLEDQRGIKMRASLLKALLTSHFPGGLLRAFVLHSSEVQCLGGGGEAVKPSHPDPYFKLPHPHLLAFPHRFMNWDWTGLTNHELELCSFLSGLHDSAVPILAFERVEGMVIGKQSTKSVWFAVVVDRLSSCEVDRCLNG